MSRCLGNLLLRSSCSVAVAIRVRVSPTKFVYPDVVVVCGKPAFAFDLRDTITNPQVIAEVQSPSTADFNRGGKFELYRELPSLKDYVLVSQTAQRVEVYHRTAEGDWLLKIYDGPEATAQFPSLDAAVALSEIYGDILTPAAE